MGDFGESLIGGGVNVGKGVGGLVANGREAKLAEVEEMVEEGSLFKADIFDVFKADDIKGFRDEGSGGVLDESLVGDEEDIRVVDVEADEAGENENEVENTNNKIHNISTETVVYEKQII